MGEALMAELRRGGGWGRLRLAGVPDALRRPHPPPRRGGNGAIVDVNCPFGGVMGG